MCFYTLVDKHQILKLTKVIKNENKNTIIIPKENLKNLKFVLSIQKRIHYIKLCITEILRIFTCIKAEFSCSHGSFYVIIQVKIEIQNTAFNTFSVYFNSCCYQCSLDTTTYELINPRMLKTAHTNSQQKNEIKYIKK